MDWRSHLHIAHFFRAARSRAGLAAGVFLFLSSTVAPGAALAQETTATIRGVVIDAAGEPLANARVEVLDERTGIIREFASSDEGVFLATRLSPGGPYSVIVNESRIIRVESITVADIYNLTIDMNTLQLTEEATVTAEAFDIVEIAPGPAATFSSFEIDSSVGFNRDIIDIYGLDPRLNIDNEDDGFEVNCAGKNPRFNSVTLDGVSQNDRFGLNSNGYSTAVGMPFPFDAIDQLAVELAPANVTYGGFTACNINAVTKSGTNMLSGNGFFEHTSDSLRGTTLGGVSSDFSSPPFNSKKFGVTAGGPIVRDQLFAFGAWEATTQPRFLARGYAGSGNGTERTWLSQADHDRIVSIANAVYGYDPGGLPVDGSQEEDKFMTRVDWNVGPRHNVAFIVNYYDGFQDRDSDGDQNEFEFANHFYVKGATAKTFTGKLASQWSDTFSTEVFISRNDMDDSQVTVGPKDFGDFQISLGNNTVYLGADDSRQANQLYTDSNFFKLSMQKLTGQQVLTGGYEMEALTVFNQFVQHSRGGEYDFFDDSTGNPAYCAGLTAQGRLDDPDCGLSGIDKFELGRPSRIYYGSGGGTNDPETASAKFTNTQHAIYLQDEIFFDEQDMTVVAGIRWEFFTSGDAPVFNPTFSALSGIDNDASIDGLSLIMPRVGVTVNPTSTVSLRASAGRYSGGNPNVWLSNAWSNDGVTNVQLQLRNFDSARSVLDGSIPLTGGGQPGRDVPQELFDTVAATTGDSGNTSFIALIDPDYVQPSEWKFTGGISYRVPDMNLQLDVDYLLTTAVDSPIYVDVSQEVVGMTAAGSPIYDFVRGQNNFMLTNSTYSATSNVFSAAMRQFWASGLDLSIGYAFTAARDISQMASSVAGSNFGDLAVYDINDPMPARSNFGVPHRISVRASYPLRWAGGLETRFNVSAFAQSGQPQSFAMSSEDLEGDGQDGRHLLYVPDGAGDPNVVFGPDFDTAGFFAFVDEFGLSPGFVDRNSTFADWSRRIDLGIDQDIPIGPGGSTARAYFKLYNLGNFLSNDWGKVYDAFFVPQVVVDSTVDDQGRFVFENFNEGDATVTDLLETRSLWEARWGLEFLF